MTELFFRKNIATIMAAKGISSADLAKRVGIAPASVSRILSGVNKPSFDNIGLFAQALGVPVARLFIDPDYTLEDLQADEALTAITNALHKRDKTPG